MTGGSDGTPILSGLHILPGPNYLFPAPIMNDTPLPRFFPGLVASLLVLGNLQFCWGEATEQEKASTKESK